LREYIREKRKVIDEFLTQYLENEVTEMVREQPWGSDVLSRLREFAGRGKMIRGALVYLGASLYGVSDDSHSITPVAASMELLQSFLLIHDDIMDEDEVRRGSPAVFAQYRQLGSEMRARNAQRFGESMAICAGDVAVFLATRLIAGAAGVEPNRRIRLVSLVSEEIARVGLAQMDDIYQGTVDHAVTADDVLALYRYKTGRYTFSLPLMAGATIAGASESDQERIGRIGEALGIIFQIKDDELELFGDESTIGKPVGSDISEDKKTLHRMFLFQESAQDDESSREIRRLFGRPGIDAREVERVRELMVRTGVTERVAEVVDRFAQECRDLISALQGVEDKEPLEHLLAFNLERVV